MTPAEKKQEAPAMSDKPVIVAGLALFVAAVTFPIWYPLVAGGEVSPPDRQYPNDVPRCIEERQWMVGNHMNLLKRWRKDVVRGGDLKPYKDTGYLKSLTRTCMEQCHSRKEMCDDDGNTSCRQCHSYAGVELDCWNCHVEPEGN
jgi:hypothetical protein